MEVKIISAKWGWNQYHKSNGWAKEAHKVNSSVFQKTLVHELWILQSQILNAYFNQVINCKSISHDKAGGIKLIFYSLERTDEKNSWLDLLNSVYISVIFFSVSRKRQERKSFSILFSVVTLFLVCNLTRIVYAICNFVYPYSFEHYLFCDLQKK